jgi:hypothetical protein
MVTSLYESNLQETLACFSAEADAVSGPAVAGLFGAAEAAVRRPAAV